MDRSKKATVQNTDSVNAGNSVLENIAEDQKRLFSSNLRCHMLMEQVSQEDIVRRLNVSSSTVSDWCNGKKYPRIGKMMELADMLNVSLADLCDPSGIEDTDLDDDTFNILCKRAKKLNKKDQEAVLAIINAILKDD